MLETGYDHINKRKLTEREMFKVRNNISTQLVRLNRKKLQDSLSEENKAMKKQFDCLIRMLDEEIPEKFKTALEVRVTTQKST